MTISERLQDFQQIYIIMAFKLYHIFSNFSNKLLNDHLVSIHPNFHLNFAPSNWKAFHSFLHTFLFSFLSKGISLLKYLLKIFQCHYFWVLLKKHYCFHPSKLQTAQAIYWYYLLHVDEYPFRVVVYLYELWLGPYIPLDLLCCFKEEDHIFCFK